MDDQTWALLQEADWPTITCGLLRYTQKKVQRRFWARSWQELPKGNELEDLVYVAIKRVLTGKRSWDREKHPDLFKFLCDVVDSLVYHLVHSWENTHVKSLPEDHEELEQIPGLSTDGTESSAATQAAADAALELVLAEEDDELTKVVEQIMEGNDKAAVIAAATGIPVERVYRLKEKLKKIGTRISPDLAKKGERV